MRKFWIENRDGEIWDLNSNDLADNTRSLMARPDGLGIRTRIRSFEIEHTTFIEQINTQTQTIQGMLYFKDYAHFEKFLQFVGVINDERHIKLYYSPSGNARHWYKRILITELQKSEINVRTGVLEVRARFESLSMWRQDHRETMEVLNPHGGNSLAVEIDNSGNLRTSCVIEVRGYTNTPAFRLVQGGRIIDQAQYNLTVPSGAKLIIDSAPDTQRAELIAGENTTNVYYAGEKDYAYSNFIMIPEGRSTLVATSRNPNIGRVTVSWSIQREVI